MAARKVGFIGLGAMGEGQSGNLLARGFAVRGYDIDAAAMDRLAAAGGEAAASPAEAARDADLLIVLVFTAAQAEEVLFGPDGAVSTLPAGATVVLHTTGRAEDARRIADRLGETGHLMLDAPVTGGKAGADAGTLTAIVSGPDEADAAALPALEAMAATIRRVGTGPGAASTIKMASQVLVGLNGLAMVEAFALATKAGADPNAMLDVALSGFGRSTVIEKLAPFMLAGNFDPRGATAIMVKDLRIARDTAQALGLELPGVETALARFEATAEAGYERADFPSMIKLYERQGGIDVAAAARGGKAEG